MQQESFKSPSMKCDKGERLFFCDDEGFIHFRTPDGLDLQHQYFVIWTSESIVCESAMKGEKHSPLYSYLLSEVYL
jgi:hypothetical protein